MDEGNALKGFQRNKVLNMEQLVALLNSSSISARRQLKKWRAYTSFNMNGRYYTLPGIPRFDENGIWKYQKILFSKYGNLKQTMVALIQRSEVGLSAKDIAQVVGIASNSSVFSKLKDIAGITRERHQGRFVYFSEQPEVYQRQRFALDRVERGKFPSDAEAVLILVQYIKDPDISMEELSDRLSQQGKRIPPEVIQEFLGHHELLKKTLDTS